jgi:hypothetical protein
MIQHIYKYWLNVPLSSETHFQLLRVYPYVYLVIEHVVVCYASRDH